MIFTIQVKEAHFMRLLISWSIDTDTFVWGIPAQPEVSCRLPKITIELKWFTAQFRKSLLNESGKKFFAQFLRSLWQWKCLNFSVGLLNSRESVFLQNPWYHHLVEKMWRKDFYILLLTQEKYLLCSFSLMCEWGFLNKIKRSFFSKSFTRLLLPGETIRRSLSNERSCAVSDNQIIVERKDIWIMNNISCAHFQGFLQKQKVCPKWICKKIPYTSQITAEGSKKVRKISCTFLALSMMNCV